MHLISFITSPKNLYCGFIGNPPVNFGQVEINQVDGQFQAQSRSINFTLPPKKGKEAIGADPALLVHDLKTLQYQIKAYQVRLFPSSLLAVMT